MLRLISLTILCFCCFFSANRLEVLNQHDTKDDINQTHEALYLPQKDKLPLISLGYSKAFSHLLWFKTISYFGRHYRSDQKYTWLAKMCDLVTTLNPYANKTYEFCALTLAWEASQPLDSIHLLDRAIEYNETNWQFHYLHGSIQAFFLADLASAKQDFEKAAECPKAPEFLTELAKNADTTTPNTLKFLLQTIEHLDDPFEKAILIKRYNQLKKSIK